jgi:hypothetical protein
VKLETFEHKLLTKALMIVNFTVEDDGPSISGEWHVGARVEVHYR